MLAAGGITAGGSKEEWPHAAQTAAVAKLTTYDKPPHKSNTGLQQLYSATTFMYLDATVTMPS